jgi:predicted transcriptional regulator
VKKATRSRLSRREREIMEIVYRPGGASAHEVADQVHDDPGYDTIRVTLGIMTKKGHLKRRKDGRRFVYSPTTPHQSATRTAVRNLMQTFFGGSPSRAILSMLDISSEKLSREDLDAIARIVEKGKKR